VCGIDARGETKAMQTQSGNTFGISGGRPPRPKQQKAHQDHRTVPQRLQLPSNLVDKALGEVNVTVSQQEQIVEFTILVQPSGDFAEGWRTGLAIDGSASMKRLYGHKVSGRIHPEILIEYIRTGKLKSSIEDGEPVRRIDRQTYEEILRKGYNFKPTDNLLQPLVRSFTSYLAATIDGKGATALVYWGCGRGNEVEFIGEFDAESCDTLTITGPRGARLGKTTHLLPAVRYFVENYGTAKRGLFIFLTDGRINDLAEVKQYTRNLSQEIAQGTKNYCKFVLVGVGTEVDRYQLQELDNFDPHNPVDLWDYKIADEMDHLGRIFAEVVTDHQIVAPKAKIYDDQGNCLKTLDNGLPARVKFIMPITSKWFELEVNGHRLRQEVSVPAPLTPFSPKSLFDFENLAIAAAHKPSPEPPPETRIEIKATPKSPTKLETKLPTKPEIPKTEVAKTELPKTELNQSPGAVPPTQISKLSQAIKDVWRDKKPSPITVVPKIPKPSAIKLPEQWRRYALGFTLLTLLLLGMGGVLWWFISGIVNKDAINNAEIDPKSQLNPNPKGIAPIRPPYVVPKLGYLAKKVPPLSNPATDTAKADPNKSKGNLAQGNLTQGNLAQGNLDNTIDNSVIADSSAFDGTDQGIPDAVTELEILPELINEGLSLSQSNPSGTTNPTTAQSNNSTNALGNTTPINADPNNANPSNTSGKPILFRRNLGQGSLARVINRSIDRSVSIDSPTPASTNRTPAPAPSRISQKSIITPTSSGANSNSASSSTALNNSSSNSPNSNNPKSGNSGNSGTQSSQSPNTSPNTSQSNLLRVIVYFDLESSAIKPEEARKLRQFWQKVNGLANVSSGTISIVGHTDAKGDNTFNVALSKERSESVTRFLEAEGMDRDRYRVVFEGKSSYLPITSNDTKLGRAMNRRVELRFKP